MSSSSIAALLAAVVSAAPPTEMPGLVASSASARVVENFTVPALGDLHSKYHNLPDSCEVLVRVSHSSVNPADRYAVGPFPQIMGSDIAGTVLEIQGTCRRLSVGDRVWADIGAVVYYGFNASKGKENGAFAPIAVALESQLGPMPRNLDFEEAASLPKVSLTGYKALVWYGGAPYTRGNYTILVIGGSGGCGMAGIQLAKALGASRVITTASSANVGILEGLGADAVIDHHVSNWWNVLPAGSIDVVYDTVGQSGTGDHAMAKLKDGGFFISIVGQKPSSIPIGKHATTFINSDTNLDNLEILEDLRRFVEADKLRMPQRKVYGLDHILDAFRESAEGHVSGKLCIRLPMIESCAEEQRTV